MKFLGQARHGSLCPRDLKLIVHPRRSAHRLAQAGPGGCSVDVREILGHSATEVTDRYAHLQPGNFTEQERALVDVQLAPAKVLPMAGRDG